MAEHRNKHAKFDFDKALASVAPRIKLDLTGDEGSALAPAGDERDRGVAVEALTHL